MLAVINGCIIDEVNFRDMAQAQDFSQLLPDIGRRAVQAGLGLLAIILAAHQGEVNLGLAQVGRDINRSDRDEADTRVLEPLDQQVRYLMVDGFGDPLRAL